MDNSEIAKGIRSCILLFATVVVLSLVYTVFITWGTQILFPYQAGGSLIYVNGTAVGSQLIGQNFSSPGYSSSRPSAVDYNASNSGGSRPRRNQRGPDGSAIRGGGFSARWLRRSCCLQSCWRCSRQPKACCRSIGAAEVLSDELRAHGGALT